MNGDVISLSPSKMEEIRATDPVLMFIKAVNVNAAARPEWNKDFRAALYEAFAEEVEKHWFHVLKAKRRTQ